MITTYGPLSRHNNVNTLIFIIFRRLILISNDDDNTHTSIYKLNLNKENISSVND